MVTVFRVGSGPLYCLRTNDPFRISRENMSINTNKGLIADMMKGRLLRRIWLRTGSLCNDSDYHGPFSVMCDWKLMMRLRLRILSATCDTHKSVGERKQRVSVGWRNLFFGSAYNYKFYGSDCDLGLASRIHRPPITSLPSLR